MHYSDVSVPIHKLYISVNGTRREINTCPDVPDRYNHSPWLKSALCNSSTGSRVDKSTLHPITASSTLHAVMSNSNFTVTCEAGLLHAIDRHTHSKIETAGS